MKTRMTKYHGHRPKRTELLLQVTIDRAAEIMSTPRASNNNQSANANEASTPIARSYSNYTAEFSNNKPAANNKGNSSMLGGAGFDDDKGFARGDP